MEHSVFTKTQGVLPIVPTFMQNKQGAEQKLGYLAQVTV
jgi:hypothetical protein